MSVASNYEKATFAGGCFWCMVKPFDEQPGIERVISGYTGGLYLIQHMRGMFRNNRPL